MTPNKATGFEYCTPASDVWADMVFNSPNSYTASFFNEVAKTVRQKIKATDVEEFASYCIGTATAALRSGEYDFYAKEFEKANDRFWG